MIIVSDCVGINKYILCNILIVFGYICLNVIMRSQQSSCPLKEADVLRVWAIVNDHYTRTLSEAGRHAILQTATTLIDTETKHKRAVVAELMSTTREIREYIRELEAATTKPSAVLPNDPLTTIRAELLSEEWHFLYLESGSIFGYMQLVPGSSRIREIGGGVCIREAEFTLPNTVLDEALRVEHDETVVPSPGTNRDGRVTCPCCNTDYTKHTFWKHGLYEIISNGNKVPGYRFMSDVNNREVWCVDRTSGWMEPIYRPRQCYITMSEIGQGFTDLAISHVLSDKHFSHTLDVTFSKLAGYLKQQL